MRTSCVSYLHCIYKTGKEVNMNIYVGNISYEVTEDDLKQAFGAFGQVENVKIIKDKWSGQPRGFGFVEMPERAEAHSAISGLNGKDLKGRTVKVDKARSRSESRRGGGRRSGERRFY
jgi:RNA recognition motif-containing protein